MTDQELDRKYDEFNAANDQLAAEVGHELAIEIDDRGWLKWRLWDSEKWDLAEDGTDFGPSLAGYLLESAARIQGGGRLIVVYRNGGKRMVAELIVREEGSAVTFGSLFAGRRCERI